MKFHDFKTMQSLNPDPRAQRMSFDEYFAGMANAHMPGVKSGSHHDIAVMRGLLAEQQWVKNRRPFYHAYPAVCRCLERTKLNFTLQQLSLELEPTAICFAVGHEPEADGRKVESIGFSIFKELEGDVCPPFKMRINFCTTLNGRRDRLLQARDESEIANWQLGPHTGIVALCVGIAILASDDRFAEPILLKRDEDRELTPDQRLAAIERAKRNGRNGIAIGKNLDISPHMRRPHFGIRWTDKGRSVPKLVPIKGCLVSRSKLYPIPTGYLG